MTPQLTWPAHLSPQHTPVYTYNEITLNATPEQVWSKLVRAGEWSRWYRNCKGLRFLNHEGPDLKPYSQFSWWTFGVRVNTRITEFEPGRRLAWHGSGLGAEGYHGWLILPTLEGCRVITEEVQKGLVPSLGRFILKPGLLYQHQRWLEGLDPNS